MTTGPSLEPLLRRLIETPPDFLDAPRQAGVGRVHVAAVVHDLFASYKLQAPMTLLEAFASTSKRNVETMSLAAVVAWLLADDVWRAFGISGESLRALFAETVPALAGEAKAARYVHDAERREELVRSAVARLELVPDGETPNQAADRLASLSSVERRRLLDASRASEARARAIREALARKAAEESADKWTRE